MRAIRVRDANGDELTLYEYRETSSYHKVLGLGRGGGTRLALDTGEAAEQIDDDNYVIVATGEKLARVG